MSRARDEGPFGGQWLIVDVKGEVLPYWDRDSLSEAMAGRLQLLASPFF